jgi:hypothetical protein
VVTTEVIHHRHRARAALKLLEQSIADVTFSDGYDRLPGITIFAALAGADVVAAASTQTGQRKFCHLLAAVGAEGYLQRLQTRARDVFEYLTKTPPIRRDRRISAVSWASRCHS